MHNFISFCSMFVIFACQLLIVHIEMIWRTHVWHLSRRLVTRFARPQTHLPAASYVFMIMAMIIPSSPTVFVQQLQNALATLAANWQESSQLLAPLCHPLGAHLARFELKIARHSCCRAQVLAADVVLAARQNENETLRNAK